MTSRKQVIETIRAFEIEVRELAGALSDQAWTGQAYENGWNARQLLCHIASTSGVAQFLLTLARAPAGGVTGVPTSSGGYDIDEFNRQQVAMREGRTVAEITAEIVSNLERGTAAVEAAPDEELAKRFRAPWGIEGSLAEVIAGSFREHLGLHLADLRSATRPAM